MARKYTQINNLVSDSRSNLHKAYDRGYDQAKKDYQPELTQLKVEPSEGGLQFRCIKCNRLLIAHYPYCPYCGRVVKEESVDD